MKIRRRYRIAALVTAAVVTFVAYIFSGNPWDSYPKYRIWSFFDRCLGSSALEVPKNFTGVWRDYHENGKLQIEISLKDGMRHGSYIEYGEDGEPAQFKNYQEGERVGKWGVFVDGQRTERGTYKDGRPREGVCELFDRKIWTAEFRAGAPYNGRVLESAPDGEGVVWNLYHDGVRVAEDVGAGLILTNGRRGQ